MLYNLPVGSGSPPCLTGEEQIRMKIAICEFRQESDAFNPVLSDFDFFERGGVYEGRKFRDALYGKQVAVGGMLDELEKAGIEPVMLFSMHSDSGGPVRDAVVRHFIEKTTILLTGELPVDGVLVSMHGATQSESIEDVCGYILEAIRDKVGPEAVISASFDLHANITAKVQQNADFICGYQTYPHVDFFSTGARAARLLIGTLSGKIRARTYRTVIPMIVPASSYTTLRGPFGALAEYAHAQVDSKKILDYTIFQMQPWLDVEQGGTCVVTVGEDEKAAKAVASDLAGKLFDMRDSFKQNLYTIDEVIRKAEGNNSGKPIVLVDSPDSPNAGACGDSPAVLERIKELGSNVRAAFYIKDAPAVNELWNRGVGSVQRIRLGATLCHDYYKPVDVEVEVLSVHNGVYMAEGPSGRGTLHDCGRVVTVRWRNVDIVICESISFPGDPQIYRHFGVEPEFYQLVNVKACTSFRAAYESIAQEICETDTPGTAPINLRALKYRRLPKTFYPFNDLSGYRIPEPVALR